MNGNGRRLISWGMGICLGMVCAFGAGTGAAADAAPENAKTAPCAQAQADPAIWQALQTLAEQQGETLTALVPVNTPEKLTGAQATDTLAVSGAVSLQALAWLPRLKTLTLTACDPLDLTSLAALPSLEALTLTDCATPDLQPLAACPKLKSLTVTQNGESAAMGTVELTPLANCARLNSLRLSGVRITGLDAVATAPRLINLSLEGLQGADVSALANATGVKTLRLYGASGASLATALAGLPKLEGLWLGDCDLTPEANAALWNCTKLKNMGLSRVNGVSADAEGWARLKSLTSLTMDGGALDGLAFLAPMTSTTVVRLTGIAVGETATVCTVDFDKYFLSLSDVPATDTLPILTAAKRQWNYAALLTAKAEVTAEQIAALSSIKGLLSLEAQNVAENAFAPECWNGYAGLQQLMLTHCKAVSLAPIGVLPSLNRLSLTDCGVAGESAIAGARKLRQLSLTGCDVEDWAFLDALTCEKSLTTLAIAGCDGLTAATFVSRLPALTDLALEDTAITDLQPLTKLTNLQRLYLYGTPVADYAPLSALNALQRLGCSKDAALPELTAQIYTRRFVALP